MPSPPRDLSNPRWGSVAALAVIALLGLGACVSADDGGLAPADLNVCINTSDAEPETGGSLRYGLSAETNGWNPASSQWAPNGMIVARTFFDTLTTYDAESVIQPFAAESVTPNDDFTEWTIALRPGLTFHGGRPVTADDVARGLEVLRTSPLTRSAFEPVAAITVVDGTVRVTLKKPWTTYPYALATQIGVVADPDWLASGASTDPIGTGPFEFGEWTPGDKLVVERNQDYWQDGLPLLDRVEFRPIVDSDSRVAALQSGDVDIIQLSEGDKVRQFAADAGPDCAFQVFNDESSETAEVFIQLNTKVAPLDDPEARAALAYATDKDAVIDVLQAGAFTPASGPFSPSSPWYRESGYPSFDPVRARELVESVKRRNGGSFRVELLTLADPVTTSNAAFIQEMWASVGIEVVIDQVDQAQLISSVATGDFQATQWRQFSSPNPVGDSIWWHPRSSRPLGELSLNFARNENPRIGEALDAARQTDDVAEQRELYGVVQREMNTDIPYIWLYHAGTTIVADRDVVNVTNWELPDGGPGLAFQSGSHPLSQVWISGRS